MKKDCWEQVYESLTCHISEPWRMSGVEDEDEDVECIIQCFMNMERELCRLMFAYGQKFSEKGSPRGKA